MYDSGSKGAKMTVPDKLAIKARCCGLTWKALAASALLCVAVTHSSARGKNKEEAKAVKPNLTPLMIAALSCDENQVTASLAQGADVKALDARGNDALTFASTQRNKDMFLQCPNVVSALTKAGADPWKANFYQSPELQLHQPSKIAVLRVQDIRAAKDDRSKGFAEGVEQALSQGRPRYTPVVTPHYPIMRLSETREQLKAAGFSEEDAMHPDRKRACSMLGVDARVTPWFSGAARICA
jgi:ankyrin repeat protein